MDEVKIVTETPGRTVLFIRRDGELVGRQMLDGPLTKVGVTVTRSALLWALLRLRKLEVEVETRQQR